MTGQNPLAMRLRHRLRILGEAFIFARKIDLKTPSGTYPAIVDVGATTVRTSGIIAAPAGGFTAEDAAAIDAWEDCDPNDPAASLYWPVDVTAYLARGGSMKATAYALGEAGERLIKGAD